MIHCKKPGERMGQAKTIELLFMQLNNSAL